MGLIYAGIGVPVILFQPIARGIHLPITTGYLNKHIPSQRRATVLSLNSMALNPGASLMFPVIGVIFDAAGIHTGMLILAGIMLAAPLGSLRFIKGTLDGKKEPESQE